MQRNPHKMLSVEQLKQTKFLDLGPKILLLLQTCTCKGTTLHGRPKSH